MSEEVAEPVKKEAAVLSTASLSALATDLAEDGLVVAMMLNIPTYTLVKLQLAGHVKGLDLASVTHTYLDYWKDMRATAKDRDKVADLERALRESGHQDHADIVVDRHKDNAELTADIFPSKNDYT